MTILRSIVLFTALAPALAQAGAPTAKSAGETWSQRGRIAKKQLGRGVDAAVYRGAAALLGAGVASQATGLLVLIPAFINPAAHMRSGAIGLGLAVGGQVATATGGTLTLLPAYERARVRAAAKLRLFELRTAITP